jgi:DnaJ like chaperone protein
VPPRERRNLARFFDLARQSMAGFESYAKDLARLFRDKPGVLEDVLDALFAIALADGGIHPREQDYLALAAEIFGFSESEFDRIRACHMDPELCNPYRVLGLEPDCGEEELKQAYRRLVRENHPDSLIGRGVPAEFVAVATAKLAAINRAHDEIMRRRRAA